MRRNPNRLVLPHSPLLFGACSRLRGWHFGVAGDPLGVVAQPFVRTLSNWAHRLAHSAAVLLLLFPASTVGATSPVELHPCPALQRLGTMDENGIVSRPVVPRQLAADMVRRCDYAMLGRFVSVTDSRYDKLLDAGEDPVVARFEVVEVLRGDAVVAASIRLARDLLAAPGHSWSDDLSRYASVVLAAADDDYREEVAAEVERELTSLLESGGPMTQSQHDRLVEAARRMVWLPERTRYEQHQLVNEWFISESPLNFYSELGGINPDEVYLLGLSRETESPGTAHFGPLHTFLFWGQEAQDVAAALRDAPD